MLFSAASCSCFWLSCLDQGLILDLLTEWASCGVKFATFLRCMACDQLDQRVFREDCDSAWISQSISLKSAANYPEIGC